MPISTPRYDPENPTHRRELAMALIDALGKAGFIEDQARPSTEERVFTRGIEKTHGRIVVYTTVVNDTVRSEGSDAIRIAGVIGEKGVFKNTPVHRTGSVSAIVARTLKRARETWVGVRSKHPVVGNGRGIVSVPSVPVPSVPVPVPTSKETS